MEPHQANLQPNLLLNSRFHFNLTPTFLWVTFNRTLSFSKHICLLKAKFISCLKALCCISASFRGCSKESLSLLYKAFLWLLLTYASPRWFSFLTPPRRLSSYDDGEENVAHPHMMICQLRQNACIEERCQKGKEDLSQASFKYTHFAVAGKSSYVDERRSLRHHHMMISDAEGLSVTNITKLEYPH